MRTRAIKLETGHTPQSLARQVRAKGGLVLLESAGAWATAGRLSFVAVAPALSFRSLGARCETTTGGHTETLFGNPWRALDTLLGRYDLGAEADIPFPAGFCAGYWGYELRQFVEPKLRPHPAADLSVPDCWLGFYDSLVVFDHETGGAWVVSTGLQPDGSRCPLRRDQQLDFWRRALETAPPDSLERRLREGGGPREESLACRGVEPGHLGPDGCGAEEAQAAPAFITGDLGVDAPEAAVFLESVRAAQRYIRQGDIYQVNLSRCWEVRGSLDGWALYRGLTTNSPAPFAACLEAGDVTIASASPELFLRFDGLSVQTRPIKGTRPRGPDLVSDAALAAELRSSEKEAAELTMITDLLRNDLGKVSTFGSVRVPELMRLEAFSHVQHLVSTVTGRLRSGVTQLQALESCFPGGSITGAPKFRAMQIIDELEPVARGPYTGCLGYLGFNRQSQLSILIRTAVCHAGVTRFHAGAGIVADSNPAAEAAETVAKARGFLETLDLGPPFGTVPHATARMAAAA